MQQEQNRVQSILLDVNVCIDIITKRALAYSIKKQMFSMIIAQKIKTYIPACSIDTIYYILTSSMKINKELALNSIIKLIKYTNLLHSSDESVHFALNSGFPDFEDGLINSIAVENNIDAIITSNTKDFKSSSLPVYSPTAFITISDV